MKYPGLAEITEALFNEGYWQKKYPDDRSFYRGLRNLRALGFTPAQLRQYKDAVKVSGFIVLADQFMHNSAAGLQVAELPAQFDLKQPSGFASGIEDPEARFAVQAFLESVEFKYRLRSHFVAELRDIAMTENLPGIGEQSFSTPELVRTCQ